MSETMRGIDDVDDADFAKEGGRDTRAYIQQGRYLLEINRMIYKVTRKGLPAVIGEYHIIESTNETRPVGTLTTRYFDLQKERSGLGELKAMIAATYGVPIEKVTKDVIKAAVGTDQPLAGKRVRCSAQNTVTKKGGQWTEATWIHDAPPPKAAEVPASA